MCGAVLALGAGLAAPAHADFASSCDAWAAAFASTLAAPGTAEWTTVYNNYIAKECIDHGDDPPPQPKNPGCGPGANYPCAGGPGSPQ
jgi:hypothetical protein